MEDQRTCLLDSPANHGSNRNEESFERINNPDNSTINTSNLRHCNDVEVRCNSLTTRLATPTYADRLLGTVPNVTVEVEVKTRLYKRRWYILVIFSLYGFSNVVVWNTWGPISASSEDAFDWDDGTISLLTNWGPISFIVGAMFFSWLMNFKGLRWAVISSMTLIVAGCGIRCISSTPPMVTWMINVGSALNGLAEPVAMFGPPVVSTTWFGPHERTTATALSLVIVASGLSATYVLGPFLVPDRLNPNCTKAMENNSSLYNDFVGEDCAKYFNNTGSRIAKERKDIMFLLHIQFGWSVLILLLLLIYFPKKPPLPPSVSASQKRENFVPGLKTLLRRSQFWIIALVYGVASGIADCWSGLVDVIVKPYGLTEKQAGWMGFYGNISQIVLSLIVARFADKCSRHYKLSILGMYVVAVISFICFGLICVDILPFSMILLYTSYIVAIAFLYGSQPLVFELCGEMTYPVAEETATSLLTLVNNFVGVIFLFIPLIPHIGTTWMNWTMIGAVGVCLPSILLLKERYYRLEVDEHSVTKSTREYCHDNDH